MLLTLSAMTGFNYWSFSIVILIAIVIDEMMMKRK
jgi:hypothetical protein